MRAPDRSGAGQRTLRAVRRSLRLKLMLVVLATTLAALAIAATAMVAYQTRAFHNNLVADLMTQADVIGLVSAPAIAFSDQAAARENLSTLRLRPQIVAAALYTPAGAPFAVFAAKAGADAAVPAHPEADGYRIDGGMLVMYRTIREDGRLIGTVYLRARYDIFGQLLSYLGIVGVVVLLSLLGVLALSPWFQAVLTRPILAVTNVARDVMARQDFSLRVTKTTDDDIGYLVDAFNNMLAEIGRRTAALEQEMGERRNAEEALRAADRRKDEFLATLSHELRNPLAPIRNSLHMLRLGANDPAMLEKARAIIERQIAQMVHLVDDLLDVSRITRDKLELKREQVELTDIVQAAVETNRAFIESQEHRLRIEVAPVPLFVDPLRLTQVVSNLLHNAAKYTRPGGELAVVSALRGRFVQISVSDTGIGIAPGMLAEVFEMFVQVDRSLERSYSGLGVGLTLAKRLVELHGGVIEAASDGLGRGSRFTVLLPLATARGAAGPAGAPTVTVPSENG